MITDMKKMDVITNNFSNSDTTGYKKELLVSRSFEDMLIARMNDRNIVNARRIGPLNTGVHVDEIVVSFTQGPIERTDRDTDLTIKGDGFIVINSPNGERYTRSGSFNIDSDGFLVTDEGYFVMGENGPMRINTSEFTVDKSGTIYVNGESMDTIRTVTFENLEDLRKEGDSLYYNNNPADVGVQFTGELAQGYLEASNVDLMQETVNMIEVSRSYETNQRIIRMLDDTLGKAVNDIGRV
jgi:flagellar basal-body rod protein FlgG